MTITASEDRLLDLVTGLKDPRSVDPVAFKKEVERARRKILAENHPDHHRDNQETTDRVNRANTLSSAVGSVLDNPTDPTTRSTLQRALAPYVMLLGLQPKPEQDHHSYAVGPNEARVTTHPDGPRGISFGGFVRAVAVAVVIAVLVCVVAALVLIHNTLGQITESIR